MSIENIAPIPEGARQEQLRENIGSRRIVLGIALECSSMLLGNCVPVHPVSMCDKYGNPELQRASRKTREI